MTPIRADIAPALTSKYTLRPYQQAAVDAAVAFFRAKKVEDLELRCEGRYKWAVWNAATNRQLTNVTF